MFIRKILEKLPRHITRYIVAVCRWMNIQYFKIFLLLQKSAKIFGYIKTLGLLCNIVFINIISILIFLSMENFENQSVTLHRSDMMKYCQEVCEELWTLQHVCVLCDNFKYWLRIVDRYDGLLAVMKDHEADASVLHSNAKLASRWAYDYVLKLMRFNVCMMQKLRYRHLDSGKYYEALKLLLPLV